MTKLLNLYKPVGMSPLEAIKVFKEKNPEYNDTKMTYAGRLDPMAEGVLIILAGEGIYEKDKYLKLDKEYEAEIIFGFSTDTHDLLGLPKGSKGNAISTKQAEAELKKFVGDFSFSLPRYSSYKIKNKPLFQWARERRSGEASNVKRTTQVRNIEIVGPWRKINSSKLLKIILEKINLVGGDFRQEKIKTKWQKILEDSKTGYPVMKIKVSCSSGTYIRSLADKLGKKLKTRATLLSLKRTRVGEFSIKGSIMLK